MLTGLVPLLRDRGFLPIGIMGMTYLGEDWFLAGRNEQAGEILVEVLRIAEDCGATLYVGWAHRLLREIALTVDFDQAIPCFDKAISLFREIKAEDELALPYSAMGRYHKKQGNKEQTREFLTKALEIFERLGTLIEPDKVGKELAEFRT